MKKLLILALLLVPLLVCAEMDYVELSISSVTNSSESTTTSTVPISGMVRAVHVEITPTAGTWTNTVTLSTAADRGVSFADNAILTLTDLDATTNYVYYPTVVAQTSAGADVAADANLAAPFYLLADTLKLNATNTSTASTNAVKVRVVFED